jgi:hypothetical protein
MQSLPYLLLYVALCASFFQFSSAAPAAACVVSYYVTTYLIPATPNPTPGPTFTAAADIIATTSDTLVLSSTTAADPPTSSSTTPTLPTNGGLCHHPVYLYPC